MDSLSQIVLGAAVAEVCVGRKIGNKALLWGAIAGTIPDLDVITNLWMDEFTAMTLHRGFSHSIIFCVLASPIFAWIWLKLTSVLTKKNSIPKVNFKGWTLMFFWCFITHIALDCLTTWGTQIFWPLSPKVSANSIFVADPLYTVPLLIFLIIIMFFRRDNPRRVKINRLALIISTGYLVLGLFVKIPVNNSFAGAFEEQGYEVEEFKSRPMPLNIMLWTVNAKVEDGYLLGYYSIFDEDKDINFRFIPRNDGLDIGFADEPLYAKVMDMTQGWYSFGKDGDDLLVNDLRFGQPEGWNSGLDEFVFQYRLAKDENGVMEVHSPKPPRPNSQEAWEIVKAIFRRALGNKDPSSGLASR